MQCLQLMIGFACLLVSMKLLEPREDCVASHEFRPPTMHCFQWDIQVVMRVVGDKTNIKRKIGTSDN